MRSPSPFRFSRRHFLAGAGATLLTRPPVHATAETPPLAAFLVVGDTHFLANRLEPQQLDATSAAYTRRLVDVLNRLPGSAISPKAGGGKVAPPGGLLHVGDIIDTGDKNGATQSTMQQTEWAAYLAEFGNRLKMPVMDIAGNHDSPHGTGFVIEQLAMRQRARKNLKNISSNGLHYSWEWGGVHFAALGLIVGTDTTVTRKRRYAALDSLAFLKEDLAASTSKDQPLVIMHHVDMARYTAEKEGANYSQWEWDPADVHAFHEVIKDRRTAIFYGHTHHRDVFRWNGKSTKAEQGVAVFNVDNSAHFGSLSQALFYVEVRGDGLLVREYGTIDGWETGRWTEQVWSAPI